jgi:hypothetical protein
VLWQREASWLSDPAREGRGLGSAGLADSALRIAAQLEAAGLEPGAPDGSYLQRFRMPVAIRVETAALALDGEAFVRERDYNVLYGSENGAFGGPVAFAGYGASEPERGRDDWLGLPERAAIVLVLELREVQRSPGALRNRRAAALRAARARGVLAVLFAPAADDAEELRDGAALAPMEAVPTRASDGVIALALSSGAAERIAARAGLDLASLSRAAARGLRPALSGGRVSGAVHIARDEGEVANVVARLTGADAALAHEEVLIGAHYDHIGRGEFGSLQSGGARAVHPGADDNASGAAGLVALAAALAAGPRPARTLVFVAFTAEEAGLVGSARYLEVDALRRDVVAMLALDMIGRFGAGGLTVFGAETGRGLASLVSTHALEHGLPARFAVSREGPSDQESFRAAKIPALLLSTGAHAEYHTPDDRAETLDAAGAARVLALAADLALALANADTVPAWEEP